MQEAAWTSPYRALIEGPRVSARTRTMLRDRAEPVRPGHATVLNDASRGLLAALLGRVLPQHGGYAIDLAARIDRDLAAGRGDGWRFAILPPDADAYRAGLETLAAAGFAALDPAAQDAMLGRVAAGQFAHADAVLDGAAMRAWFEDVRADAVRTYVSHPATMARIGYSGIAYGGDGEPIAGFAHPGANQPETWEPVAEP